MFESRDAWNNLKSTSRSQAMDDYIERVADIKQKNNIENQVMQKRNELRRYLLWIEINQNGAERQSIVGPERRCDLQWQRENDLWILSRWRREECGENAPETIWREQARWNSKRRSPRDSHWQCKEEKIFIVRLTTLPLSYLVDCNDWLFLSSN